MKIRIERDALAEAVAWTSRALGGRNTGTASGIGIEANGDTVIFTTFDRETSARAEFEAVVEESGTAMVPGRLLVDISKTLPSAPVQLQLAGGSVDLTCGRAAFTLPVVEGSDFPEMMELPPVIGGINGGTFAEAVGQVAGSASNQDSLQNLTGVRIEFADGVMTMAATDRYRLAVREAEWRPAVANADNAVLVPAGRIADIAKGLADCDEVHIYVPASGAATTVGFSGKSKNGSVRSIATNLLNGNFPDRYRDLLPSETPITAYVNTADLLAALKRVRLVLDSSSSAGNAYVAVQITEGEIELTARGIGQSEAREVLAADNIGEIERVQFNPGYFIDGLSALGRPYVRLGFTLANKPVLISGAEKSGADPDADFRYLLMPMRGNSRN